LGFLPWYQHRCWFTPRPGTSKKALLGGGGFPQKPPEVKKVEIVIFRTIVGSCMSPKQS